MFYYILVFKEIVHDFCGWVVFVATFCYLINLFLNFSERFVTWNSILAITFRVKNWVAGGANEPRRRISAAGRPEEEKKVRGKVREEEEARDSR